MANLIAGTRNAARPDLAGAGAVMLLTAGVVALGAQVLYSHTPTGQDNAARALGLGILAGLAGLRVLLTPGPHPVASGLALATGAGFVLLALLADHPETKTAALEAATGAWVMLAAVFCMDSPSPASDRGG